MTLVLILVAATLAIAIAVRQAVRGFAAEVSAPEQLIGRTRPIDLLAFRNLIDPAEDEFLRAHLPRRAFHHVRRARSRAAISYVRMAAHNAAILICLGMTAKSSSETHLSEAGEKLLTVAIQTRILAGGALLQLYAALLAPWWQPSLNSLGQTYTDLRASLDRVALWQRPDIAGTISEAV